MVSPVGKQEASYEEFKQKVFGEKNQVKDCAKKATSLLRFVKNPSASSKTEIQGWIETSSKMVSTDIPHKIEDLEKCIESIVKYQEILEERKVKSFKDSPSISAKKGVLTKDLRWFQEKKKKLELMKEQISSFVEKSQSLDVEMVPSELLEGGSEMPDASMSRGDIPAAPPEDIVMSDASVGGSGVPVELASKGDNPVVPLEDQEFNQLLLKMKEEELKPYNPKEDVNVLVGKMGVPITVLRKETASIVPTTAEEDVERGLKCVGIYFNACQVKGDGHCFFRSLSVEILQRYSGKEKDLLSLLQQKGVLSGVLKDNIENCLKLIEKGIPPNIVMRNQAISDSWVQVLRLLSTEWIMQVDKEALQRIRLQIQRSGDGDEKLSDREVVEKYCKDMRDMGKAKSGGDIEMYALSNIFKVPIGVIDLDLTKNVLKGNVLSALTGAFDWKHEVIPNVGSESYKKAKKEGGFFILKKGKHYNVLEVKVPELKKRPRVVTSGELIERKRTHNGEQNVSQTEADEGVVVSEVKRPRTDSSKGVGNTSAPKQVNQDLLLNSIAVLKMAGFQSILNGLDVKNEFAANLEAIFSNRQPSVDDEPFKKVFNLLKDSGINLEGSAPCDVAQILDVMIKKSGILPLLNGFQKISLDPFYRELKGISIVSFKLNEVKLLEEPEKCVTVPLLKDSQPTPENIHAIQIPEGVYEWDLQKAFTPVRREKQVDFQVDEEVAKCDKDYIQLFNKIVSYEEQLCLNSPKTLFVKLDRFVPGAMWKFGYGAYQKDCTVRAPYYLQAKGEKSELKYQLTSVVVHEGGKTPDSGMYSTYIPDETSGFENDFPKNWKDEKGNVFPFSEIQPMIEKSGYLFSYKLAT